MVKRQNMAAATWHLVMFSCYEASAIAVVQLFHLPLHCELSELRRGTTQQERAPCVNLNRPSETFPLVSVHGLQAYRTDRLADFCNCKLCKRV